MAIDAYSAAAAYQEAARAGAAATRLDRPPEVAQPDFSGLVARAIAETDGALKAGERAAYDAAAGEAGLVDVVTAISAAEVALETAIAVRNRVIEAYQEVMRMPI